MIDLKKISDSLSMFKNKVSLHDSFKKYNFIGGIDYFQVNNNFVVCFVILDRKMKLVDKAFFSGKIKGKITKINVKYYIGQFASDAYRILDKEPDIVLVRGQGILEKNNIGLASYIGVLINRPTIGISKAHEGKEESGKIYLDKEIKGIAVLTKEKARKLYISPGHMISLGTSLKIIKESIHPPHKLPEPIHIARKLAKKQGTKLFIKKSEK